MFKKSAIKKKKMATGKQTGWPLAHREENSILSNKQTHKKTYIDD